MKKPLLVASTLALAVRVTQVDNVKKGRYYMKVLARRLFAAVLTLSATAAHAAWTPEEREELRKIGETAVLVQDVLREVAVALPTMLDPRSAFTALEALHVSSHALFSAFGCAHGQVTPVSNCRGLARPDQVARMLSHLDRARNSARSAEVDLGSLGQPAQASRLRILPIDSFHRGLKYLDPRSASWPNVVGPHGDVNSGLGIIDQAQQYGHSQQADLLRAVQQLKGGNIEHLSDALNASALVLNRLIRIVSISADAALADDEAQALADSARGSGLRPPSFFRTLLSLEYATNNSNKQVLEYRSPQRGAAIHYQNMIRSANSYFQSLPPDQLVRYFTAAGDAGLAREFYITSVTSWRSMDQWVAQTILFFRPPSPPPGR